MQQCSNMLQPSLQHLCLWHAGLRPLMPRVAVGFPFPHCKYDQIDQQKHAKATYLSWVLTYVTISKERRMYYGGVLIMSGAAAHFWHGKVKFAAVASEASLFSFSTKFAGNRKPLSWSHLWWIISCHRTSVCRCKGSCYVHSSTTGGETALSPKNPIYRSHFTNLCNGMEWHGKIHWGTGSLPPVPQSACRRCLFHPEPRRSPAEPFRVLTASAGLRLKPLPHPWRTKLLLVLTDHSIAQRGKL